MQRFIKIPNAVFELQLTPMQLLTYAAIVSLKSKANHARFAFPGLSQIAKLANICIDTVIKAVRKLEAIHIITYSRYIRKCGCFGHNNYTVIDFIKTTIPEHKTSSDYILNENKYSNIKHKLKKAGLKFLNKMWYSKFWATILDSLKNVVRKKNKSLFNTQYL